MKNDGFEFHWPISLGFLECLIVVIVVIVANGLPKKKRNRDDCFCSCCCCCSHWKHPVGGLFEYFSKTENYASVVGWVAVPLHEVVGHLVRRALLAVAVAAVAAVVVVAVCILV